MKLILFIALSVIGLISTIGILLRNKWGSSHVLLNSVSIRCFIHGILMLIGGIVGICLLLSGNINILIFAIVLYSMAGICIIDVLLTCVDNGRYSSFAIGFYKESSVFNYLLIIFYLIIATLLLI